ncbi:flagellar hook protein FlgE [soil metagenome]
MSFQQGLSGLNAASKNIEVIGNNVSNANTVGFKASRTEFADIYANAMFGSTSNTPGIGTRISKIAQQFTQGNVTISDNPMDVAINGSGFFRLNVNGATTYTRNGQFEVDNQEYVVNASGGRLTGYAADAQGNIVNSAPTDLRLSKADISPVKTSTSEFVANLDSRIEDPITSTFNPADSTTFNNASGMSVYDTLGNAHSLQIYFRKSDVNQWQVFASENGTQVGTGPITTLQFSTSGALTTGGTATVSLPTTNGSAAPLTFSMDFNGTTQFGSAYAPTRIDQDGYATGHLSGYSIGDDGVILGRYTNGLTRAQGQIVMADFANEQGLVPLGNNQWAESSASGQAAVGRPTTGALGSLQSGAVEDANIDLTKELVDMIVAQRTYQANAQTIKTEDAMLQTLVNLR